MELKIKNLERNRQNGLVQLVHYELWHDGECIYGVCELLGDPSSENFVPFENLTEAQVLQWLEDKLSKKPVEVVTQPEYDDEGNQIGEKVIKEIESESQLELMQKQLQSIADSKKLVQGLPF